MCSFSGQGLVLVFAWVFGKEVGHHRVAPGLQPTALIKLTVSISSSDHKDPWASRLPLSHAITTISTLMLLPEINTMLITQNGQTRALTPSELFIALWIALCHRYLLLYLYLKWTFLQDIGLCLFLASNVDMCYGITPSELWVISIYSTKGYTGRYPLVTSCNSSIVFDR